MEFDCDKVDDAVLALLWLTARRDEFGASAWKGHDWDAMNRLHEKGFISDPRTKAKSVRLTKDGYSEAERLFTELFGGASADPQPGNPRDWKKARKMPVPPEDAEREGRITMEIVVDAYDEGERAMGWYCYLWKTISRSHLPRPAARSARFPH